MNAKERIEKEHVVIPLMLRGYRRKLSSYWFELTQEDTLEHGDDFAPGVLSYWHKRGYLSSSLVRWGTEDLKKNECISDFDYMSLLPMNNIFEKWLYNMLTTQKIIYPSGEHFRKIYYSIIRRENKRLILRVGKEDHEYTCKDILDLIIEKGEVELRPSTWNSKSPKYIIACDNEGDRTTIFCNGKETTWESLEQIINELDKSYVVVETVPPRFCFGLNEFDHEIELWIANDIGRAPQILSAEMHVVSEDSKAVQIDLGKGAFDYNGQTYAIPEWDGLKDELVKMSSTIRQISFFSVSVAITQDGSFTYLGFSCNPQMPRARFGFELDNYLKTKLKTSVHKRTASGQVDALWQRLRVIEQKAVSRKGMRQYMYDLWRKSALDDLLHTKGISIRQKIWAHRHGFFSWRIYQYGLTKDNYSKFLSDYDYHWLNRINNEYQIWVNDKTTFRYVMEPFKEFIPDYYFSVVKRNGETVIYKMCDCPADIEEGFDGILELLRRKGKLAFKASAGTHGDGFYCLSFEDGVFSANGEVCGEEGLRQIVEDRLSFYVITEYLEMHSDLKRIYDKSVNTVRMMVVNDHGYDPRVLQTYMRIGSSKTGYTDNVGYGGICAFVNTETGELYQPERLVNHRYVPCPVHPDTKVPIAGTVPNWNYTITNILKICRYFCELEYLGFDVAITDNGFQILEINIHQDLHKVAAFNEEINEFFTRKIEEKKQRVIEFGSKED